MLQTTLHHTPHHHGRATDSTQTSVMLTDGSAAASFLASSARWGCTISSVTMLDADIGRTSCGAQHTETPLGHGSQQNIHCWDWPVLYWQRAGSRPPFERSPLYSRAQTAPWPPPLLRLGWWTARKESLSFWHQYFIPCTSVSGWETVILSQ